MATWTEETSEQEQEKEKALSALFSEISESMIEAGAPAKRDEWRRYLYNALVEAYERGRDSVK